MSALYIVERVDQPLIEGEEIFHPFAVGPERGFAIEPVDGEIEIMMRLAQGRGHGVGVIEIGQGRCRIAGQGAGVEDSLGEGFDPGALGRRCFGPREIIVNKADRVAISTFEPATDLAHPRHVHMAGEDGEMPERRAGKDAHQIAGGCRRFQPADRDIVAAFRTDFGDGEEGQGRDDRYVKGRWRVGQRQRRLAGRLLALFRFAQRRDLAAPIGRHLAQPLPDDGKLPNIRRGGIL